MQVSDRFINPKLWGLGFRGLGLNPKGNFGGAGQGSLTTVFFLEATSMQCKNPISETEPAVQRKSQKPSGSRSPQI